MGLVIATAPAAEPISTADAKLHLRVDITDDNDLIDALVKVAREHVEIITRRALITQTWDYYLDDFPGELYRDSTATAAKRDVHQVHGFGRDGQHIQQRELHSGHEKHTWTGSAE